MPKQFIVGEVSKNWIDSRELYPTGLLSQQFEDMINGNLCRGYRLHSFQVHQLLTSKNTMNETVIAVFERIEAADTDADDEFDLAAAQRDIADQQHTDAEKGNQ